MKKHLLFLVPLFSIVFMAQSLHAQQDYRNVTASTSINFESNEIVNFELEKKKNLKSVEIPNVYKPISIDESAFTFKASKAFGSYVIPNTNYLKIVSPEETVYTNAEFINKKTGKQIFSFRLDLDRNVVDMSYTKAGVYTLILTNKSGDRYEEDIMIM